MQSAPVLGARLDGATAGVTRQGSQVVFASSTAPVKADRPSGARSEGGKREAATRPSTASQRTVVDDVWSQLEAPARSPIAAAEAAAAGGAGGLGTGVMVGLLLLGVTVSGLAGALLAGAGRRRVAARRGAR